MSAKPKSEVALSLRRTPAGWVVVEYTIKEDKIIRMKESQPENRALALEALSCAMEVFWRMES